MSDELKTVGSRIRVIRRAKNVTLEALAEQLEIEPNSLGRIEKGVHLPSLKTLEKLAKVLQVSMRDFLPESNHASDEPTSMNEVRIRLYEFIPYAEDNVLMRWYRESLKDDTPR
jgi:transcriptional regulator with XRE-family HTH domain